MPCGGAAIFIQSRSTVKNGASLQGNAGEGDAGTWLDVPGGFSVRINQSTTAPKLADETWRAYSARIPSL
jgi:hypothetical protein